MAGIIDEFNLDWMKGDQKRSFSKDHPEADAFQKICGDILNEPEVKSVIGNHYNLISFPLRGKDGAIDHFSFCEANGTLIVECKKNNTVKNCLSEINKLQGKLLKNLSKSNATNTVYRPWFNKNYKSYIFCTSCSTTSASEYESIVYAVRKMLQAIAAIPGLSHIGAIEAKVYCWQHLKSWLEKSPYLMYKWVEPGVEGLTVISSETLPEKGYQSYLSSHKMSYYSRDEFMQLNPNAIDLPSEKKYLNLLIREVDNKCVAIVIHGQGGIGKTRLMYELAFMAKPKGWMPYLVKSLDDFKSLSSILRPGGRYLILIDYVEEFENFHYLVKNHFNVKRRYEVRFIVNCRSSYFNYNRYLFNDEFISMDISDSSQSAHLYYREIINKIVRGIPGLTDLDNLIFERRPSYAVFVRFLYENNVQHYNSPNKDIKFQEWLIKRLELSFTISKDKTFDKGLVTKIFCCFPARGKGLDYLEQDFGREINILISDGWVEKRELAGSFYLAAIHDSIVDELLIEHLRLHSHTLRNEIKNILTFAGKGNLIDGCIRAIERIFDRFKLSGFDFNALFKEIVEDFPDDLKFSDFNLAHTSLITLESKIRLLHNKKFYKYVSSRDFWIFLFKTLGDCEGKELIDDVREKLNDLFNIWCKHNNDDRMFFAGEPGGVIIHLAIRVLGFTPEVEAIILDFSNRTELGYFCILFCSLLIEAKGATREIGLSLNDWLNRYENEGEASIVINAWLNAGGDKSVVVKSVKTWLKKYAKTEGAYDLIIAWLRADGERSVINTAVEQWLSLYAKSYKAINVLWLWILIYEDISLVKPSIIKWLQLHAKKEDAYRLIWYWLALGGDRSKVKHAVVKWLRLHSGIEDAYKVLNPWLENGGEKKVVASAVKNWLALHAEHEDAYRVMTPWLDAAGDKSLIVSSLELWLSKHTKVKDAYILIAAWLKAKGAIDLVIPAFREWLEFYGTIEDAEYLVCSWLRAGGDKVLIIGWIEKWLELYGQTENANVVMFVWLDTGGDKTLLAKQIKIWLEAQGSTLTAGNIIGIWLQEDGERSLVKDYLEKWLVLHANSKEAFGVMYKWLEQNGDISMVAPYLENWVLLHGESDESFKLIYIWLKQKGGKSLIEPHLELILKYHAHIDSSINLMIEWLNAGGSTSIIASGYKKWLGLYTEYEHLYAVIEPWLKAGGEKSILVAPIKKWLAKYEKKKYASEVICSWLEARGEKTLVESSVKKWLSLYEETEDAFWVIGLWLQVGGEKTLVAAAMKKWLLLYAEMKDTEKLIYAWLESGGDKNEVEKPLIQWVAKYNNSESAGVIKEKWLKVGGDPTVFAENQKN